MDIILDMGNVLLEWNKDKILKAVAKTEKDYLILDKEIFQSGLWERLDLGTLTREELVDKVLSILGDCYQDEVEKVIWNWPAYIDIYSEVFPLLAVLKEKAIVFLSCPIPHQFFTNYWKTNYLLLQRF